MRDIILDTETTGLNPNEGHRIIEIGAVELVQYIPTKKSFQAYLNPERDVPEESFKIHGLSFEFLLDKPLFSDIAEEFIDFISDSTLIIHNANFDLAFLNAELKRIGLKPLSQPVIDTLPLARAQFPGERASLDALCRRFGIDTKKRAHAHGALIDCELLAEVYLELTGKKQGGFDLTTAATPQAIHAKIDFQQRKARPPSKEELSAHQAILDQLEKPIGEWP